MIYPSRVYRTFQWLQAIAAANTPVAGSRMAAAIVCRNRLIAVGRNSMKSSPMQKTWGRNPDSIFLHAEIDAIRNSLRSLDVSDFRRCDLYVCRVRKNNSTGLSRPCGGCSRAIVNFGIRRVYYSTDTDIAHWEVL